MLQKGGQVSKAREMSPVLYIQPFHTRCLTCNRRQSLLTICQDRYSRENVRETNTKYKLEFGNGEKLTCSHTAKKFSSNLLRSTWCLPYRSFLAITFIITSQQAAIAQQKYDRSRPFFIPQFLQSLPKNSLSSAKLSLCQNRGRLPLNRDFVPNTGKPFSESTKPTVHHLPIQSVLRHFTPSSSAVDTGILVGSHGHFCFLEMWISVRRKVN